MAVIEKFKDIKVLEVTDDYFLGSKGYQIFKYDFLQKKYDFFANVIDGYRFFATYPLFRRFLRAEINGLYSLKNGNYLLIAKKGIFYKNNHSAVFRKVFSISRGSRPLNLCELPNGHIYWGEYFANIEKEAVHIYVSIDGGLTWKIAYTFSEGNINHIHGLFWDEFTNQLWFCTGDRENECIIGYTEDEFQTIVEVFRGNQEYRSCQLFFYEHFVVFATDSQYVQNEIKMFARDSMQIKSLVKIQGTAIKGGQLGNISFLSTTVEPSKINKDRYSHLWITDDGINWREIFKEKKDIWPFIFQFGSIEFPIYKCGRVLQRIFFNGRALKNIDGCSLSISLE